MYYKVKFYEDVRQLIIYYELGISLRYLAKVYNLKTVSSPSNVLLRFKIPIKSKEQQISISNRLSDRSKLVSQALKGKIRSKEHSLNISKGKTIFKIDKDYLFEQYVANRKSCKQISEELGCVRGVIELKLKRFGIKARNSSDYPSAWKGKKNPALTERNLRDNPSKRPEVRKKKSEDYKANPKLQLNSKLKRDKITILEKRMIEILTKLGYKENYDYVFNKFIKTNSGFKFPDFRFLNKNIIIECDGIYWHKDIEKDKLRDEELQQLGYRIYHFNDNEINDSLVRILEKIL